MRMLATWLAATGLCLLTASALAQNEPSASGLGGNEHDYEVEVVNESDKSPIYGSLDLEIWVEV